MAIGARSQSARTYLEKNLDKYADSNQDELIKHCMRALRDTLPNEVELTVKVFLSIFNVFFFFLNKIYFRIVLLRSSERIHHSVY